MAETFSPVELYDIRLEQANPLDLDFREDDNAMILILQGSVMVAGEGYSTGDMLYFSRT